MAIADSFLSTWTPQPPVVGANRLALLDMGSDGNCRTQALGRLRFSMVFELASRPSKQLQSCHQAENMGDTLCAAVIYQAAGQCDGHAAVGDGGFDRLVHWDPFTR